MDCTFGCCTTTSSSPPRENSFQTLHQIWTEVSRLLLLPGKEELLMTFHLERKKIEKFLIFLRLWNSFQDSLSTRA